MSWIYNKIPLEGLTGVPPPAGVLFVFKIVWIWMFQPSAPLTGSQGHLHIEEYTTMPKRYGVTYMCQGILKDSPALTGTCGEEHKS